MKLKRETRENTGNVKNTWSVTGMTYFLNCCWVLRPLKGLSNCWSKQFHIINISSAMTLWYNWIDIEISKASLRLKGRHSFSTSCQCSQWMSYMLILNLKGLHNCHFFGHSVSRVFNLLLWPLSGFSLFSMLNTSIKQIALRSCVLKVLYMPTV